MLIITNVVSGVSLGTERAAAATPSNMPASTKTIVLFLILLFYQL
jgi:hypothetical protein